MPLDCFLVPGTVCGTPPCAASLPGADRPRHAGNSPPSPYRKRNSVPVRRTGHAPVSCRADALTIHAATDPSRVGGKTRASATPEGCLRVPRSAGASFPPSPSPSVRRVSPPRRAGAIARHPRTACVERAARRRPPHDTCDLWGVMVAFSIIQDVPRLLRLGRTFYPPQRCDHSTATPIAAGRVCWAEHISARWR